MFRIGIASLFLASILVLSFTNASFAHSEDDDIEIEIEVEVEDGIAKVEAEFDGQELEFVLEETDRDAIINEIIERTGLTREQIEDVIKFEVEEEEDEHEEERNEGKRLHDDKIAVCHIPPGNPSKAHTITVGGPAVDRHLAHGDEIGSCDGQEFSAIGESKFAEKQAEREAKLAEKQMEIDARLAEQEAQALQRAEELIQKLEEHIQKLEQRIADLEQRLQSLVQA